MKKAVINADWALPYRVGLSDTSPHCAAGFSLLSLTQLTFEKWTYRLI